MYQMCFTTLDVPDAFFNARCIIRLFASDVHSDHMCCYDEQDTFQWPDAQLEPDVRHHPDVFADQMSQQTKYPQRARFPHRPNAPTG